MMKTKKKLALFGDKPTREKYLVFGEPDIQKAEIDEVVATLKSGWIGKGPRVEKFENQFKNFVGAKYALAVNSCTAGLHLALLALEIGEGSEVITTTFTFAATANVIVHVGAKPVLVDVDPSSMNINPQKIEKAITKKTKAIIVVHFAGRPCQMKKIMAIAKKYRLFVIEDAAHAIEAKYNGKNTGTIGDIGVYSFYATKNMTTAEGGMIVTNNKKLHEHMVINGLHGLSKDAWNRYSDEGYKHYLVMLPGYKYYMTDIAAAMGIHQLKRIKINIKKREKIWQFYNQKLKTLPFDLPSPIEKNTRHARHLYTILIQEDKLKLNRDQILDALHRENIGTGVHFVAIHLHPFYQKLLKHRIGDFPIAENISKRTISLPLSAKLTIKDADDVVKALRKICDFYAK